MISEQCQQWIALEQSHYASCKHPVPGDSCTTYGLAVFTMVTL